MLKLKISFSSSPEFEPPNLEDLAWQSLLLWFELLLNRFLVECLLELKLVDLVELLLELDSLFFLDCPFDKTHPFCPYYLSGEQYRRRLSVVLLVYQNHIFSNSLVGFDTNAPSHTK